MIAGGAVALPNGFIAGAGRVGVSGTQWAVLLTALAGDASTNILSTPVILATDNEDAEIVVGQEVPFVTGQYTGTLDGGNDNDTDPDRYEPHHAVIESGDQVQIYEPVMLDTDGGVTWEKDNEGLPGVDKGRIGLAIARSFVEAHGGTLTLQSRTDRAGTVAEIILPRAGSEA